MVKYAEMTSEQLQQEAAALDAQYKQFQAKSLKLDISRGKPDGDQLKLSMDMLDVLNSSSDLNGYGNYGLLEGIPEARAFLGEILGLAPSQVFVGGSASLNMMHDCLSIAYIHGLKNSPQPWCKLPVIKFLCPSPGYDRHFAITQHLNFELILVPMTENGPDMDMVEELAAKDEAIKGIWCVPKYSNPTGVTYSDETVRRLASMKTAAPDFTIMWDNAYAEHHFDAENQDHLLDLMEELKKSGNQDRVLMFTSTAKVTFPGAGISAIGGSEDTITHLSKHFALQTISYDKLNMLRHVRYFDGKIENLREHMKGHGKIMAPKFAAVLKIFDEDLAPLGIAEWTHPKGGYFISLDVMDGCAKRTVALCKEAGVTLTGAGAAYPYGKDPRDRNIRVAPSFATIDEVQVAASLLTLCARIASVEKLLAK